MSCQTLPLIAVAIGAPLDPLRKLVREDASLRGLGTTYGPTRLFDQREIGLIAAAWRARVERRKHKTAK